MQIKVVDFDIVTRSFVPYIDGFKRIEKSKEDFIKSIEPQKKELESIVRSQTSGLIIDEITQKSNIERFKSIQEDVMKLDQDFKIKLKKMTDELNTDVYDQLSEIISDWAEINQIDMVMGKMEVIFANTNVDATNTILEILKEKNLFHEERQEQIQN